MGPYDKPFSPQEYLMHYGVKGMKWGVRRYQNEVLPKSWTKVMRQSHFEFCIGQDLTHSIFL